MKPVDFRNATLADLQGRLVSLRAEALTAWLKYGPGTTAEIAQRSGISILTLRPRTTELAELGFVRLAERLRAVSSAAASGHEGVYRARTHEELMAWFKVQKEVAHAGAAQTELPGMPARRSNFV
jgi:hypothetical protein